METANQGNPPTVNELIAMFVRKLDEIQARLDRIETIISSTPNQK
jgi:hypothetical protein